MVASVETPLTIREQIEKWHGLLLRFAGKYARRYQIDTDEAYQWIALFIVEHWDSWDQSRGAFSTWLHVVVPSAFLDLKRQLTMRSVPCVSLTAPVGVGSRDGGQTLGDFIPDPHAIDIIEQADARSTRDEVRAAISSLPPHERAVIERRYYCDESLESWERDTIASALARLANMLRCPNRQAATATW